jgi:anti-anti-sigma factor
MRFKLPFSMDAMEIDDLIRTVMQGLESKSQEKWVVDLTEAAYMGSSMLGMMVNIRQRIRQGGGKLALFGLSDPLMRTFQACCLERLFTISKTRAQAIAAVGG